MNNPLNLAKLGWQVFPAPVGSSKKSHIAGLKHGGPRWGATSDPDTVDRYWRQFPGANVGVACGPLSGFWCLDVDTPEGHDHDGHASLRDMIARNGPLPHTVASVSPSGSMHFYFRWPGDGDPIRNSTSRVAPGIDVRGDGGMVIAPPSVKPDGQAYRWQDGCDPWTVSPVPAPDWLVAAVRAASERPVMPVPMRDPNTTPHEEIRELLTHIDPDADGYDGWFSIVAGVHEATAGSDDGLTLIDEWSQRSAKYDPTEIIDKWHGGLRAGSGGYNIGTVAAAAGRAGADLREIGQRHRIASMAASLGDYRPAGMSDRPVMPRPDPRPVIEVKEGNAAEVAANIAGLIAAVPEVFRTAAGLVKVARDPVTGETRPHELRLEHVQLFAPKVCRIVRYDKRTKQVVPANMTQELARLTIAQCLAPESGVRVLRGVIVAPTMTPDGRMIQEPGFDEGEGLFLQPAAAFQPVPDAPSADDLSRARQILTAPFAEYRFRSDTDRAVLFSAILTAVVRRSLPTAPAYAVEAAQAGSGKTLMALSLGALTCGAVLSADGWPRGQAEIKKAMLSKLRSLPPAIIFDNIESEINSADLAAILTSPVWGERVLGASEHLKVPTNTLLAFTGNNLAIGGDMNRRTLRIRISPPGIDAHAVRFSFNPLTRTRETWPEMVWAGLVVLKAYIAAGRPRQMGIPFGSFEAWAGLVRDATMWCGFSDPVAAIAENYADDQETETLAQIMQIWALRFGEQPKSWAGVLAEWPNRFGEDVRSVLDDPHMTFKRFQHWFGRYRDRPHEGRQFQRLATREGKMVQLATVGPPA